jgi:hypothetical protein
LVLSLAACLWFGAAQAPVLPLSVLTAGARAAREWLAFLGLAILVGFAVGSLWAQVAVRGRNGRTVSAGIAAVLAVLAVAGAGLVVTPVRLSAFGWSRGEACYRGLPASYWVAELGSVCWDGASAVERVEPQGQGARAVVAGQAIGYLVTVVTEHIKGDAVPGLVAMLNDPEPVARNVAAGALTRIGPDAAAAVPALIDLLRTDADTKARARAAGALGKIGLRADDAVPALAGALNDGEPEVRCEAARALGSFGPVARAAVPGLTAALADGEPAVRQAAARALGQIDPAAARKVGAE